MPISRHVLLTLLVDSEVVEFILLGLLDSVNIEISDTLLHSRYSKTKSLHLFYSIFVFFVDPVIENLRFVICEKSLLIVYGFFFVFFLIAAA